MCRCGCSNNNGNGGNTNTNTNMNTNTNTNTNMATVNLNGANLASMPLAANELGVTNLMYGHAYVPVQNLNTIFSASQGLSNGTMFPELVSVYNPNQSLATINYLRYNNNGGGCFR